MPTTIEGQLSAEGLRFAIVASRFNGLIVESLISGALDAIARTGGALESVAVVRCPGAWELPQVVRQVIETDAFDAVIALGAVIRGSTPHFDYVAGEAARGIADASAASGVPMAFGVLTTDTVQQAVDRAGGKSGNKGFDAAMTAIEMANLLKNLRARI
jgi:6,7-dimethyl-8-ribityllumazine synthase